MFRSSICRTVNQPSALKSSSEQLALYEKSLTATRPPFLILVISGQGGVGKTTLLEQFRHIATEHDVLTSLTNEDQSTILETLAVLAQQFDDAGHPFKQFNERYQKYRELKELVEADPKAPTKGFDFALRSATRIGMRSLKRIPVAGEASELLLTPEVEDVAAEQVSAFASYIMQKFTNKDENILLLETDDELTRHFVADLNKHSKEHRITLFFDTYEKTAPQLDSWLQDLISGKFGEFSSRISFVIAGRYSLGQKWMKFRKAIKQVELQEFSDTEAREYLKGADITNEAEIAQLIKLSERLPVLLSFLISAPGSVPTDVSATAVERFLQGTTPEQQQIALAASVARIFNEDILATVTGKETVDTSFEWLRNTHFVRSEGNGWVYVMVKGCLKCETCPF